MPRQKNRSTLPQKDFIQIKDDIYILRRDFEKKTYNDILNCALYRYINFEMLYNLLNDKLIVWKKGGMSDKHEAGELYNNYIDSYTIVGDKPTD